VLSVDVFITDDGVPVSADLAESFSITILGQQNCRQVMCSLLVISVFRNIFTLSFVTERVKPETTQVWIFSALAFLRKERRYPFLAQGTEGHDHILWQSLDGKGTHHLSVPPLDINMIWIILTRWLRPSLALNFWVTLLGIFTLLTIPSSVSASLVRIELSESCGWKEISAYGCGLFLATVVFSLKINLLRRGCRQPSGQEYRGHTD